MRKKQPINVSNRDTDGVLMPKSGKMPLKIAQIRHFSEQLKALPANAVLPDWTHLSLGDRFAAAMLLMPAEERVAALGKSLKQLDRYRAGGEIPVMVMAALGARTELPLDWLITGRAMQRKPPPVRVTHGASRAEAEDVPLQKLAFRASAGHGSLVVDEDAEWVHFPRMILDRIGVKPQHARLMESTGESMVPTIADRDTMVVDVSNTQIVEGKIYVFSIGDEVLVKRLRRVSGQVFMFSDNRDLFPKEEPVPADQHFTIFGRAMWSGRSL